MARVKVEKVGIDAKIEQLEKRYGISRKIPESSKIISTGSLQLNKAMGVGGTSVGKIIEIFGQESSGKSTITLHQICEYQKAFPERKAVLIDFEHSFDRKYAANLGVDVDNLLIYQPETQESAYDIVIALIDEEIASCIVIDSQSAAIPKAVLEGEMGDATIGLQARNNSKFCMKVKGRLDTHNCTLFLISQTRSNIGGMSDPTTTTGGNAIKFYADIRWKVWKMNDKVNELNKTTIDVIKNKLDCPFGQAKINIIWGKGFDTIGEIIDYAVEFDFIKKAGAGWYTIEETKLQGDEKVKQFLEDNPELLEDWKIKINNLLFNKKEIKIEEDVESEN